MIHEIKGVKINTIGDPHLGREFKTGVPLHRRGEREKSVMRDFERELHVECDLNVVMGDLFDKAIVPPEVVLYAAQRTREAARMHPETFFVILMGNHDPFKDADKKSSFDVFAELVAGVHNIIVVNYQPIEYKATPEGVRLAFFPYDPFRSARELAESLPGNFDAAFGHWDVDSFGGDDSQLIPLESFQGRVPVVFTGHVHKPETRMVGQVLIHVTGSLQPYAHGEEVNSEVYITCTLQTAKSLADEGKLRDKCVRVLIQPGESLDFEIDCLALTTKAVDTLDNDENLEVNIEDFDFANLFRETFKEHEVSEDTTNLAWAKYTEAKA